MLYALVLLFLSFVLVACGGGGGGGGATAYTIGGTVSGLTGTVILQNNNVDDLSIIADGTFAFATAIANDSSYNITVLTQPNGQTCTISNASGTVANAGVTNVTVTCSEVAPLYGAYGFDWNDYVQGSDITNAADTACNASTTASCLHGGEIRMFEVTGESSCTGITASDALGAFNWICDDSTGTVRAISSRLTSGYGLVNLLDFAAPGWKENSLTVYKDAIEIETTTPAVWWSNPVVSNTMGGILNAAGTVYVVPIDTTATYTLGAESVSLVAAPGIVINGTGSGSSVISATGMDFLWIEGMRINAAGDNAGVYWDTVRFSVMRDLIVANADTGNLQSGVYLRSSSNNTVSSVTANNNGDGSGYSVSSGIYLNNALNNTLSDMTTSNNGWYGVHLHASSNNILSDVITSNNRNVGIDFYSSSNDNKLSSVTASNNSDGVGLWSSSDNTLTGVTASNNVVGVYLENSSGNVLSGVTASNNRAGVLLELLSSNNTLSGLTASNNGYNGVSLHGPSWAPSNNNTLSNVTTSNNGQYGISLWVSSDNYFTGNLKVGNNLNGNCNVDSGTNPGLVHSTCANNGISDAILTTGVSIAGSFVAKVNLDDSANTSDTNGVATLTDALSFDWTNFENTYRAWGRDGGIFPDATNRGRLGCSDTTYTNQTDCEANSFIWSGGARIWDWSLLATDTVIKDSLPLPTGDDTLTHTWSDTSTSTILRNAVEMQGDGIGNDNTLCETNETCLYTPNMGSYQGHGNLISAGSIGTGGMLENIILMKYETNGY